MRMLCISWKNKRSGFTKRARWYADGVENEEQLGTNVRMCLEDEQGMFNFYPANYTEARAMFDAFKAGRFDPYQEWHKEINK